jgi:hypothetical protein
MGNKKNCKIFWVANILILVTMINDILAYKEWWEGAKVKFYFLIFW